MRNCLTVALLLAAVASSASAQVLPSEGKKLPAAQSVLDMLGSPMSKVFTTFGLPIDATTHGKKSPYVQLDYGHFTFSVREKQVFECYVWSDLPGDSNLGFNFGDALDDATKRLGKPQRTITNADGDGVADWNAPNKSRQIEMIFNPAKKCSGFGVMKGD